MKIEFDPDKSERNARERDLPFNLVADFDFETSQIEEDDRRSYGEVRYRAIGRIGDVVAAVVFTIREDALRVISLRLAGRKERMKYEQDRHQEKNETSS
jgi:uncharacterized DUF497 family protein